MKLRPLILLLVVLGISCAPLQQSVGENGIANHSNARASVIVKSRYFSIEFELPTTRSQAFPSQIDFDQIESSGPYTKLFHVPYEWEWEGPLKGRSATFTLEVAISYFPERDLLEESLSQKRKFILEPYEQAQNSFALERIQFEEFNSSLGIEWLESNMPTLVPIHRRYRTPVSNHFELSFWFWFSGAKAERQPSWFNEKNKVAMEILNSVRHIAHD